MEVSGESRRIGGRSQVSLRLRACEPLGKRLPDSAIVRDAFDGVRRFGAFQESLDIARNILTDRLRLLVEAGVLDVVPASDGSAYQEYVLKPKGEALFPVIVTLRKWGEANLFARGEKPWGSSPRRTSPGWRS